MQPSPGNTRFPLVSDAITPRLRGKAGSFLAWFVMILAVLAVYFPLHYEPGKCGMLGSDHLFLHMRRIAFAQEALMGPSHSLPGWYPREMMGTPFWSNVQNFPFLPTRLLTLLLVDPFDALTFGTLLAAVLAATFTFRFCRQIDFSPIASAAAGWTFACAGFFAARVLAGHLPFLEAYPALPLLLWLAEKTLQARDHPEDLGGRLLWLGLASACVALAGHPQLPIYALAGTALYILLRDRRATGIRSLAAMSAGVLASAFALWPMILLTARSTRVLALAPAANDIALPYGRLAAFFLPWRDGWPRWLPRDPHQPFTAYPNAAYFWDTVCYVGWAPWIAVLILLVFCFRGRPRLDRRLAFVFLLGALALIFSLPFWKDLMAHIPGTFLRSPARLLYLTGFSLALALGAALDSLLRVARDSLRNVTCTAIAIALLAHGLDLGLHDREFIVSREFPEAIDPATAAIIAKSRDDRRVAMDVAVASTSNRLFDDLGFFDSIILARPYQGLLSLNGDPPTTNVQYMDASRLNRRTLQAAAVTTIVTPRPRSDLEELIPHPTLHLYRIPGPDRRARFFPSRATEILTVEKIHERLRDQAFLPSKTLLLRNDEATLPAEQTPTASTPARVKYIRPSPDEITLRIDVPSDGWVRVLESWDNGWSAEVDGFPTPILAAHDMFLAVPVTEGKHEIQFCFRTPGLRTGVVVSLLALLGLFILSWHAGRQPERSFPPPRRSPL